MTWFEAGKQRLEATLLGLQTTQNSCTKHICLSMVRDLLMKWSSKSLLDSGSLSFPVPSTHNVFIHSLSYLLQLRQGTSIEPCVNLSMETSQAHNSVSSAHSLTPVCWDGKCGTYMQHGYPFLMGKGLLCLNNHSYLPCYQHSPLSIWAIWSIPLVPEVLGNTTSTQIQKSFLYKGGHWSSICRRQCTITYQLDTHVQKTVQHSYQLCPNP